MLFVILRCISNFMLEVHVTCHFKTTNIIKLTMIENNGYSSRDNYIILQPKSNRKVFKKSEYHRKNPCSVLFELPRSTWLALLGHVRYINILTCLRGFRVKIVNFLSFFCLSIPKRDSNTKKTTPNIEVWLESLGAMLEYWYIERGLLL